MIPPCWKSMLIPDVYDWTTGSFLSYSTCPSKWSTVWCHCHKTSFCHRCWPKISCGVCPRAPRKHANVLPATIRLAWRPLQGKNVLAYLSEASVTKDKGLKPSHLASMLWNVFSSLILMQNKFRVFVPSKLFRQIFTSKVKWLPIVWSTVQCSSRINSTLPYKYKTVLEKTWHSCLFVTLTSGVSNIKHLCCWWCDKLS